MHILVMIWYLGIILICKAVLLSNTLAIELPLLLTDIL